MNTTFTNCAEKKAKQFLNLLQGYTKGIRMTAILILLLMGVSNAWAGAGFYGVYLTYSHNGEEKNYNFNDNTKTVEIKLGTLTADFKLTGIYLKYWKDGSGNMCGGLMDYYIDSDQEYQPSWEWYYKGSGNDRELQSTSTFTVAQHNGNSGHYTFWYRFKTWGSTSASDKCNENFYFPSNSNTKNSFTYTILPPAVSNIGISATGCIGGTGTQQDPYIVAYGASLKLTASVTNSDANSNTHYKFGNINAGTTNTYTISNITNSDRQSLTITAQNINKTDNSLKGNSKTTTIYYKYSPLYVYVNGTNHLFDNDTKKVTVALTQNNGDETYAFKIHDNFGHWLGNNGTMVRGGDAVHSEGWTMSAGAGDCKLKADLTGDYTFTFMPATNKVTVTYPQKSYFIAGSWDNWAGTAPSFVDASTPVSIYLEADQTYSFKVADLTANATWYGNNGTMTRANSTAWTMTNGANNCQINADLSGNYTFTFDKSTKKLTVTYPTKVTLRYCEFGQYGIEYDGTTYYSKPDENVEINIPRGASVRVLEGTPLNNAYTGGVLMVLPTKVPNVENTTIIIEGDTEFDDMFVTKASHTVYLNVPNNWTTAKIYAWNEYGNTTLENPKSIDINGNIYYEFSIPAGYNNFEFRTSDDTKRTASFPFGIPLNKVNCYTITNSVIQHTGYQVYSGTWGILPAQEGDYRLLYVEQTVEYGEITFDKSHPSDIVKLTNIGDKAIVSLHLYNERAEGVNGMNNAAVILQRCTGYDAGVAQWEEVEYHMVYDRLHAAASTALLPGRRNTAELQDHDGLEVIKAVADSEEHDYGSGVWNFTIQKTGESATLLLDDENLTPYTGNYYIRTNNTAGGWKNYMQPDNYMTFSQYAKDNSGFSHYYCKWINIADGDGGTADANVKFMVANDYATNLAKECAQDDYTLEDGRLFEDANVRWSWDVVTNKISRAYIQGAYDGHGQPLNNIVLDYTTDGTNDPADETLYDSGDWIYQVDVENVKPGATLTLLKATYPSKSSEEQTYQYPGTKADGTKYNAGEKYTVESKTQRFAENIDMLTGDGDNTYTVRVLYDFKIDKTLVALVPNANVADIEIDVIIERVDQGEATQVQAQINAARTTEGSTVYAVMSFTKNHITGVTGASKYAKQFYWISFPFDVRVSDVFGFGEYGKHWIIQWYDGEERAKNGCWIDSPTYWRFQTDTTDYVLEAGKGYVLTLDLAEMDVFTNTNQVSLYFPSRNTVQIVNGDIIQNLNEIELEPYTCTIQRNDRDTKDSHWHMLGVPSYANKNKSFTQNNVAYFYTYDSSDDTYDVTSSGSFNFNSMFSYMVQFAGTINWSEFAFDANGSQGLAAKRNTDNANDKHVLRLELQKNSSFVDQTFVQLQAEEATEMFDMNLDLTKMVNSGNNIYSLIPSTESNIEVAANAMPIAETIIPLGVKITAAGEYTFAMPDGTDGIVVELIDYENNTRTNMLLDEYTVNLGKGTFETRFALHVKPDKTATGVENIGDSASDGKSVKKFIIDGILYMQKDGALYNAQGHIVR